MALIFERQRQDGGEDLFWPAFEVRLHDPRQRLPAEKGWLQVSKLLAQASGPELLARADRSDSGERQWEPLFNA